MNAPKSLSNWLNRVINDNAKGTCTRIALVLMIGGGMSQRDVHVVKLGANQSTIPAMADLFTEIAHETMAEVPGVHTFNVLAFYGETTVPEAFYVLMVNIAKVGGLVTETPDEVGGRAQNMRHQEMVIQQVYKKQEHLDNMHIRMSEQMHAQNIALRAQVNDAYAMVEGMWLERLRQNNEHELKVLEHRRMTMLFERMGKLLPGIANTIAGGEVFPQSMEDTAILESLIDAAGPEQVKMILHGMNMPDEAKMVIVNRMDKHLKAKEAQAAKDVEEEKRLMPRSESGLADVIGKTSLVALPGGKKRGDGGGEGSGESGVAG